MPRAEGERVPPPPLLLGLTPRGGAGEALGESVAATGGLSLALPLLLPWEVPVESPLGEPNKGAVLVGVVKGGVPEALAVGVGPPQGPLGEAQGEAVLPPPPSAAEGLAEGVGRAGEGEGEAVVPHPTTTAVAEGERVGGAKLPLGPSDAVATGAEGVGEVEDVVEALPGAAAAKLREGEGLRVFVLVELALIDALGESLGGEGVRAGLREGEPVLVGVGQAVGVDASAGERVGGAVGVCVAPGGVGEALREAPF